MQDIPGCASGCAPPTPLPLREETRLDYGFTGINAAMRSTPHVGRGTGKCPRSFHKQCKTHLPLAFGMDAALTPQEGQARHFQMIGSISALPTGRTEVKRSRFQDEGFMTRFYSQFRIRDKLLEQVLVYTDTGDSNKGHISIKISCTESFYKQKSRSDL